MTRRVSGPIQLQHLVLGVAADLVVGEVAGDLGQGLPDEPAGYRHTEWCEPPQVGQCIECGAAQRRPWTLRFAHLCR